MIRINFVLFLVSFAIGMFFVYTVNPPMRDIYVYPTPANLGKVQYVDQVDNCFEYIKQEVKCPKDKSKIRNYDVQN